MDDLSYRSIGFALGLPLLLILVCSSLADADLQGKQLFRQFDFTESELLRLPWELNSTSTAFARKVLAGNSPLVRSKAWSYEAWLKRSVAVSWRRAEELTSLADRRISSFLSWLESKNLKPASRSESLDLAAQYAQSRLLVDVVALSHSPEFYTAFEIGTPPQPALLIIDTGSEVSWIQCLPCSPCFDQTTNLVPNIFNPSKSSTYAVVPCSSDTCRLQRQQQNCQTPACQYSVTYGDGTITKGALSTDTVTTKPISGSGGGTLQNFIFGCGTSNTLGPGLGTGESDSGLLGMDRLALSLPSQLGGRQFAYCLPQRFGSAEPGSGYMVVGDVQAGNISKLSFHDTPLLPNPLLPDFYYVSVTGISIGGVLVDVPVSLAGIQSDGTGGAVVDSGTTVTLLTAELHQRVTAVLANLTTGLTPTAGVQGLGPCYTVVETKLNPKSLPSITFHLQGGLDWNLPVENYFIAVDDSRSTFCYAFVNKAGIPFSMILGNIMQQNFVLLFDLAKGKVSISDTTTPCDVGK